MTRFMKVSDVKDLVQREAVQIIDVRSPGEFAAAHIPGAISVPMDQIESRLHDLSDQRQVVLVCQSGKRAEMTCGLLQASEKDLTVLEGGTAAWQSAGLPVVSSSKSRWSLERQVRLAAGILVLTGVVLSLTVHPNWIGLSGFVGAGLTFAGLTDLCPMAIFFGAMPWNKPAQPQTQPQN